MRILLLTASLSLLLAAQPVPAAALSAGAWVELHESNTVGVPLYHADRQSIATRLPDRMRAKVLRMGPGNWMLIRTEDEQEGWTVRKYVLRVVDGPKRPALSETAVREAELKRLAERQMYRHTYAGLPRDEAHPCPGPLKLLQNRGFLLGYCEEKKSPAWVAYRVFAMDRPHELTQPEAKVDPRTAARVGLEDLSAPGLLPVPLASGLAVGSRYGQPAADEAYWFSNVLLQRPNVYTGIWRRLEGMVLGSVGRLGEVWVVAGPVFADPPQKLPSGVELPAAFFFVALDEQEGRPRTVAYLVPAQAMGSEPPEAFVVSVDRVEALTGLDLFHELAGPIEDEIEAQPDRTLFGT
jgi:endonuclease G, mitochondrial